MTSFTFKDKAYEVDSEGFLMDFGAWDEDFAEGMAPRLEIPHGLTKEHWDVIHYIRNTFRQLGKCPLVYQACRHNGLRLKELKNLFPTGYLRGACKLAGITYKEGYIEYAWLPPTAEDMAPVSMDKTYQVDLRGFLANPADWDEAFAIYKAYEMKMPESLTARHWRVIRFLRDTYNKNYVVPTVYETCEANRIDIEELERLFPDGYHRGAVKLAGLRVR